MRTSDGGGLVRECEEICLVLVDAFYCKGEFHVVSLCEDIEI